MSRLLHRWCQQQAARLVYRQGRAHARQAAHPEAIAAFTEALTKGYHDSNKALFARALSRVQAKDIDGAIADFSTIIDGALDQPDKASNKVSRANAKASFLLAQTHHKRGLLRQQLGNEAGALADWSEAIAYWPNYPEPHYQRALVHLGQGHHKQAQIDLDAALEGNPTLTPAYVQRGNLRHQLGDIPGAVADWELAVCNDFGLESVKQKLAAIHQAAYDAKLSDILKAPLAVKGLSAQVNHDGSQLNIHVYRQLGTGVNYYTLPDLIREHLVPLHLAAVKKFQLIGHLGEINRPEWSQSYELYKGQPCPPSNWQAAFSTLVVFPPFGIPAFIQAAQVKRFYSRGQYVEALSASKSVKGLCVAGSVTLGFCTLLPLGYVAYDSMKEEPTFRVVAERLEEQPHRPYQQIRRGEAEL